MKVKNYPLKYFILIALFSICNSSHVLAEGGGADASNPTAAVNFVDFRYQAFNLDGTAAGDERDRLAIEGAYAFSEEHKITYELNYWNTNITGQDESGLESFKMKYINLQPGMLSGGLKYKTAMGIELIQDLGEVTEGIGTGTDQIAPLFGAGWLLNEKDFVITLVQYFHSYDEDVNAGKVRLTGPRVIWIHKLPSINGWLKIDDKFAIDHENDNHSSNIVEVQLGKMFTPSIGAYFDLLISTGGVKTYDDGIGVGLRVMY